jgi:nucleoid DNA-binding protein
MKTSEFTKRLAKKSKLSQAAAADQLDRVVNEILHRVRKGQPASLPGLGTFSLGQEGDSGFEPAPKARKGARR